ncbi:MAG: cyanophycin synthetase, partial [bacterium]|nr:cyanophycin synthetase [bacterium]
KIARDIRAKKLFFGTNLQKEATLCFVQGDKIIFRNGKNSQEIYPLKEISLWGKQNYENVMAAIMVSRICGIDKEIIKRSLSRFVGLEHRCKLVKEIEHISFYNDSKGTNVGATLRALQNFSYPLILIMGGKDKGGDYKILRKEMKKRVKSLIILGESKEKIYHELGDLIETFIAKDLSEAVNYAYQNAVAGDKVLFSPACSSFDMFSDYKERGEVFKELVRAIKG